MRRNPRADSVVRMEGRLAMTWYEKLLKEREKQEREDEEAWYSQECEEDDLEIRKVEALERIADALERVGAAAWIK